MFKHISAAAVLTMGLGMTLTGCSDLLDQAPYGTITSEQIDSTSVDGLLASAYAGLEAHFIGNNEAFAGPSTNWIFDVRSDDAVKGGGATSMEANIHQLEISNLTSDNVSCEDKWMNNYYAINRVHRAMNAINQTSHPETLAKYTAELKFLRAFYYFDLVKIFKYIPYLTETSVAREVNNTTYSQNEIYDFIIKDLEEAYAGMSEMPEKESQRNGHATKEAAAALLAKVYAQRGSVDGGTTDWTKVKEWSEKIVKNNKFYIYDNFGDMSKMSFNNCGESIFALQCSTSNNNGHINWSNLLNTTQGAMYGAGDDFFLASQDLVNAFRTDDNGLPYLDGAPDNDNVKTDGTFSGNVDPRLDYTVGRIGMPWKSTDELPYIYDETCVRAKNIYGEYSGKKFVEAPGTASVIWPCGSSGLNFIFLRYSDILLLHAEALIELGTEEGLETAREEINEVRKKAIRTLKQYEAKTYSPVDLDDLTAIYVVGEYPKDKTKWTQEYARKAVRMERRLELAMEGGRWFDLLRWGNTIDVMTKYFNKEKAVHTYLDGASVTKNEFYLPVPTEEITNSNGLYSDPDNK